ncbi:MAG: hypothetical protein PHI40_07975, partial [Caldisericia bacterium]|nr:hypothetical protein [Caldisericia bacterium]
RLNIKAIGIATLLLILIGWGLYKGVSWGVHKIIESRYSIEDETLYKSPPASEEIVFQRKGEGLFITQSSGLEDSRRTVSITTGDDYCPSWDTTGKGLYFIRKTTNNQLNLMYYNRNENLLMPNPLQTFTELDIPNIDNSFITISHDGKYVIVSSYDWGINVWNIQTGEREISFPMEKTYEYMNIFSRNGKFFLFSCTNLYDKQFIHGIDKPAPSSTLYLSTISLDRIVQIDVSPEAFQGYCFSLNGYTFTYAKEGSIYYVDSIESPKPTLLSEGTFPSIRPTLTEKKRKEYRWHSPFWSPVDMTNIAGFLQIPDQPFILLATPHELITIHSQQQACIQYTEKVRNQETSYMGWKLIDFQYQDINYDTQPELLATWWPGGLEIGAERISFFALQNDGQLKEQFTSQRSHKNIVQFKDLDGDGTNELVNIYLDTQKDAGLNLENLYWEDILVWNGNTWVNANHRFSEQYSKLKETYEVFLIDAIKKPDDYGESLYLIQDLLEKVNSLLKP